MFFVGKTEDIALRLAEPLAQELGVYIYDLEYKKDGADWRLTVYIDKDGGVNINDCNEFCSRYSDILDEADPITNSYCLSISSPGIERRLRTKQHYDWAIGKKIEVKLFLLKSWLFFQSIFFRFLIHLRNCACTISSEFTKRLFSLLV